MIKAAKTKYGNIYVYDNDWIGSVLLKGEYFEEELVNKVLPYVREGSNVLDVGANVGVFAAAFLSKNCFVHAFEPQKILIDLLNKTFADSDHIKIYHNAVGDTPGEVTMNSTDGNGHTFNDRGPINLGGIGVGFGGEKVQLIRIDDLNIENVSVLKIDVEGFEKLVIDGAKETIKREKPLIVFESHHLPLDVKSHMLSFLINERYNCTEKEIEGTKNYICKIR